MVSPLLLSRLGATRRPLSQWSSLAPARATRHLHIRSVSILSGLGRLAGRTAGRGALGLGVGAGALTWAEWKVDGFKQNAVSGLSDINERLGQAYETAANGLNSTLDSLSATAGDVWAGTTNEVEGRLEALKRAWRERFPGTDDGDADTEPKHGGNKKNSTGGGKEAVAGIATAMAATLPTVVDAEAPPPTGEDASEDLMILTRKLIEIRTILLSIGEEAGLQLPSIVVIGSQSSGKSSVLEAIVGREFLPKGDNMVTRRPIELTLVHTSSTPSNPRPSTFAEFPSLGPGHITDFSIVQKTLVDLNLSVPVSDCVSDSPIHLRIHSPHVPDLSLVDLPGYVQIASMDQPEELKEKIAKLCDKYIRSPNIILAVCAADVDLANSPALRAAKKVDPLGMRTIGVVTKMDLVEPRQGAAILSNNRYPLALGYVGVVCKPSKHYLETASTPSRSLLGRATSSLSSSSADEAASLVAPIRAQEADFFYSQDNAGHFNQEGMLVSTDVLKKRLMHVLEESMASSLHSISNAVALELEEASYQFKVQYNDRTISAESYVAETMDELKTRIGQLSKSFTKQDVRKMLKSLLDEQVLDLLASQYWIDPKTPELGKLANDRSITPEDLDVYWQRKLDHLSSSLTKSGIGRASTQLVVDAIRARLGTLANEEPLIHHPGAAERINATADSILRERFTLTSDQVENSVKPFKYEVEVEDKEWSAGRERAVELLQRELGMCEGALSKIRDTVGARKLRGAMEYVGEVEESERRRRERRREARSQGEDAGDDDESSMSDPTRPAFNPALLAKAREAMFLSSRSSILRLRLLALKSRRCKAGPEQKSFCPEAFLNIVAEKLSSSAVQFINIELLVEFFYQFPREIDTRLSGELDRAEIVAFARENPIVHKHLALQERKQKLELVAEKLDSLVKLQRDKAKQQQDPRRAREGKRGLFGALF